VHYAWIVAGIGFVGLVMAAGFRSTAGSSDQLDPVLVRMASNVELEV